MIYMKTLYLCWLMLAFVAPQLAQANIHDQPIGEGQAEFFWHPAVLTEAMEKPASSLISAQQIGSLGEHATEQVRAIVNWITDSEDNLSMPFMIIDKREARVFMFNAQGQLRGEASALLGLAVGDDSVPGIGERALASIRPDERTTPAGRFVASLGRNLKGGEILWIDYENAISLHPVVAGTPKERREERLASLDAHDKRISYGCINVPKAFYTTLVSTAFKHSNGIVYVLPETRSNHAVFASYYEVK